MTTRRSLCAIGACLMTVAAGVLPIGTDVVVAQQKERQAVASYFQQWFSSVGVADVSIATTKNFAVYYLPGHFQSTSVADVYLGAVDRLIDLVGAPPQLLSGDQIPEYAVERMGELEFAYQRLVDLGFEVPSGARDTLITVFIVSQDKIENNGLGQTESYTLFGSGSFVLLPNREPIEQPLRFTIAHEMFHVFQEKQGVADLMWLLEGTAEWAEDEIHAATAGAEFGYPYWRDYFW